MPAITLLIFTCCAPHPTSRVAPQSSTPSRVQTRQLLATCRNCTMMAVMLSQPMPRDSWGGGGGGWGGGGEVERSLTHHSPGTRTSKFKQSRAHPCITTTLCLSSLSLSLSPPPTHTPPHTPTHTHTHPHTHPPWGPWRGTHPGGRSTSPRPSCPGAWGWPGAHAQSPPPGGGWGGRVEGGERILHEVTHRVHHLSSSW